MVFEVNTGTSSGEGRGKPRVPHPPTASRDACHPGGQGLGKPGFPISQPLSGSPGAPMSSSVGRPGFPGVISETPFTNQYVENNFATQVR